MVPLASIVLNVAIPLLAILSWVWMLMGAGDAARLTHRGLGSLKYFTVLSNLFSAAVSVVYLVLCWQGVTPPSWLLVLKLTAASAVMLTFLTVVVLLCPRYGARSMYSGGNLWLHLVLPLLAAVDCCLWVPVGGLPVWATLYAMLPTAVYGVFYLGTALAHAKDPDLERYDFYGFLGWGVGKVPLVVIVMLLASWGIALAMWRASGFVALS